MPSWNSRAWSRRRPPRNDDGDPDPISAGTAGDAALGGGSSAAVGMAAPPLGAHKAGRDFAGRTSGRVWPFIAGRCVGRWNGFGLRPVGTHHAFLARRSISMDVSNRLTAVTGHQPLAAGFSRVETRPSRSGKVTGSSAPATSAAAKRRRPFPCMSAQPLLIRRD